MDVFNLDNKSFIDKIITFDLSNETKTKMLNESVYKYNNKHLKTILLTFPPEIEVKIMINNCIRSLNYEACDILFKTFRVCTMTNVITAMDTHNLEMIELVIFYSTTKTIEEDLEILIYNISLIKDPEVLDIIFYKYRWVYYKLLDHPHLLRWSITNNNSFVTITLLKNYIPNDSIHEERMKEALIISLKNDNVFLRNYIFTILKDNKKNKLINLKYDDLKEMVANDYYYSIQFVFMHIQFSLTKLQRIGLCSYAKSINMISELITLTDLQIPYIKNKILSLQ